MELLWRSAQQALRGNGLQSSLGIYIIALLICIDHYAVCRSLSALINMNNYTFEYVSVALRADLSSLILIHSL